MGGLGWEVLGGRSRSGGGGLRWEVLGGRC